MVWQVEKLKRNSIRHFAVLDAARLASDYYSFVLQNNSFRYVVRRSTRNNMMETEQA